jgi:hypothetical protein
LPAEPSALSRRQFLAASGLALGGLLAGGMWRSPAAFPAPPAAGWDAAAYWAFIDRVQARMDALWSEPAGVYQPPQSMVQANMLLTHAVAALAGHQGPARRDDRAARIADQLCKPPWFAASSAPASDQRHVPGWLDGSVQHLVIDEQVAYGLTVAWQARDALALPPELAARIADCIVRTTLGRYWRYPTLRLNQIGWYCRMYACAVTVGGPSELLGDLMRQVRRFVDEAKRPRRGRDVPNLGPGYRFHYLPSAPDSNRYNFDSPEYGSLTLGFLHAYADARALGMGPLDAGRADVVRAWAARVLCGYWTHAGYLNWDTGLGFHRWHQGKKVGLAQQGLLGIALAPDLRPAGYSAWAKYMLDAGFDFVDRELARVPGLPRANFFGVPSDGENPYSRSLSAARFGANAAKAVLAGLGDETAAVPPALYAYDPDIGRLAVTTPHYNTAVVPVNRNAFPYGGLDVARLFDANQNVAANVGGTGTAAFGMTVRTPGGRALLASQRAMRERKGIRPLVLTRAPKGTSRRPPAYPRLPYAGPFRDLRAEGTKSGNGLSITVQHRFTERWLETGWTLRTAGDRAVRPTVTLPTTGPGVTITAVLVSGERRVLAPGSRLRLASVRWFHVQGQGAGYVALARTAPRAAVVEILAGRRQPSAPNAGPAIVVQLAPRSRDRRQRLVMRYAPVADATEADALGLALR